MMQQEPLLNLMGIAVWQERSALPEVKALPNLIFVSEAKAAFSDAHQTQLSKILDYLGIAQYQIIYNDTPCDSDQADLLLSFGHKNLPNLNTTPYITLSISDMLSNPSCKRQVMNDIKPIKDR